MNATKYKIVGLGEILWDLFPGGKQLGGAPANFAYITSLLGDEGIAASSLGRDDLGREALLRLEQLNLPAAFLQLDPSHPTGAVRVQVDQSGQPRFEISQSVAWDFLAWTPQWQELAGNADAVCFGSLAQRSPQSRATIQNFLRATRPQCLRIFDVNLRQDFYSAGILSDSMKLASVVKLNHEELPTIMQLLAPGWKLPDKKSRDPNSEDRQSGGCETKESSAHRLIDLYGLQLVCVTRGNQGSLLVSATACHSHRGFEVRVADAVGAGDAFTAALVHEHLRGAPLAKMNDAANRVGAWVASENGATPAPGPGGIERILARLSDGAA